MTKGKTHKVVRFLISPKKKKVKIEVNKIMNPAFLLGTAFKIAYWHRKYHSGTICKGEDSEGNEGHPDIGSGIHHWCSSFLLDYCYHRILGFLKDLDIKGEECLSGKQSLSYLSWSFPSIFLGIMY